MNKKIAIIPIIAIIAIIGVASQMNVEESQTETVEIETVEETEALITIPVKAARPACGPHPECYIPSYYVTKLSEPVTWKNEDSAFHSVTSGSYGNLMECLIVDTWIPMNYFHTNLKSLECILTTVLCILGWQDR